MLKSYQAKFQIFMKSSLECEFIVPNLSKIEIGGS